VKSFRDTGGRTWTLAINVAAVKRCRAVLGLDLYGLVEDGAKGLARLVADPIALVDALYVLCKDEADKLNVSDEDFGRAMAGDAIRAGADAFLEELTDFFPDPRVRAGLKTLIAKSRATQAALLDRAEALIDGLDPAALASELIASSGSAPASSASTPGPSPSAS
jgi:hypothetical protein